MRCRLLLFLSFNEEESFTTTNYMLKMNTNLSYNEPCNFSYNCICVSFQVSDSRNFFHFSFGCFKDKHYLCIVVWPRLCDRHIENEALCFDLVRET